MKKIADNVYYIPGQADTFANIGLVFQTICNYEEALVYYQKSLACVGKVDAILYNMALCYMFLNEMDQALQMFAETVTVNPNYIMAKGWIVHIKQNQNVINNEVKNISDVVDEMLVCS